MPDGARLIVAGLGNLLLRDDGIGVHAARALAADPPADALILDIGTAVLHALSFLEPGSRVLAIDAVQAGGTAGALYLLDGRAAAPPGARASAHAWGLGAAMRLLPGGEKKVEILILGVEPERIEYGTDLSPTLAAGLPRLVAKARDLAQRWQTGPRAASEMLRLYAAPAATTTERRMAP
jgi:hydrogenase maturation protease